MKARLAPVTAHSPSARPAVPAAAARLASVIGNRAAHEAVTGTNTAVRSPLPPPVRVQLTLPIGRGPGGARSHLPRAYADGGRGVAAIHAASRRGIATPRSSLPFAGHIQRLFGRHDISGIHAHVGPEAEASARAIGAGAYATGSDVVLGGQADLHTVAHEAAHVVQQRGGVQLSGGVGRAGDAYELHANEVADAVVAGRSAEGMLDRIAPPVVSDAGRGGAVQRKNLKQHQLSSGLTEEGPDAMVGRTRHGKVYTRRVDRPVAGRTEAMAKASELAAEVGNRTVGMEWTHHRDRHNDDHADTLDPFLFEVTVPFGQNDELTLMYQYAKDWTGYVVSIRDTSNQAIGSVATMFDREEGKQWGTDRYSNVHDQDTTRSTNLAEDTEGAGEYNLDAYTKIAGEGARWQCVRAHAAHLQNNSRFFTQHDKDKDKVYAVFFADLWLNWTRAFDARYDIPDADVVKAIYGKIKGRDGQAPLYGLAKVVNRTALKAKDYDLDAHQSHRGP